jgi:hypothetical protein
MRRTETWFTQDPVDPRSDPRGWEFNKNYADQVAAARDLAGTARTGLGVDEGDRWILYRNLPHAERDAFVRVTQFTWFEFVFQDVEEEGRYLTPVFRFQFEVADAEEGRGSALVPGRPFFGDRMEVTFPGDFPWKEPFFRLPSMHHLRASHDDHIYSNGVLCILANPGDWKGGLDTVASGLTVAFDWTVWHYYLTHRSSGRRWLRW